MVATPGPAPKVAVSVPVHRLFSFLPPAPSSQEEARLGVVTRGQWELRPPANLHTRGERRVLTLWPTGFIVIHRWRTPLSPSPSQSLGHGTWHLQVKGGARSGQCRGLAHFSPCTVGRQLAGAARWKDLWRRRVFHMCVHSCCYPA